MATAQQYRKKPVVIDAMRWEGGPAAASDVIDWILATGQRAASWNPEQLDEDGNVVLGEHIAIDTLEGTVRADAGDWIIRGVQGEHYPCKPDIFDATYEPVTPAPSEG